MRHPHQTFTYTVTDKEFMRIDLAPIRDAWNNINRDILADQTPVTFELRNEHDAVLALYRFTIQHETDQMLNNIVDHIADVFIHAVTNVPA